MTEIELIKSSEAETRLLWMQDSYPELLLEMYQKGTLKKEVEKEVQKAWNLKSSLTEQGIPNNEAKEVMLSVLAPPEVETTSKPMSDKMFNEILESVRS